MVGCGVLVAGCLVAVIGGGYVTQEGGCIYTYLLAFLKQIGQILGRSPFWEGHRLGTGCDLTIPPAQPIVFSATDATKSMYD
ncbi:hypothetical protein BDR22DRAFT_876230, partial [Usnea florida]